MAGAEGRVFADLPDLETERLLLRKMRLDDAKAMFASASDPEVTRYVLWRTLRSRNTSGVLLSDQLPLRVKREHQNVVHLVQCFLRASELEMRAAEEPLKSDLDVAGLRAQVLERIEVLEERERQEIIVPTCPGDGGAGV